jgi:hypothetical protein
MKRKRKHKPSAADRLADAQERIAKALEELAKKPPVVIPSMPPIIVQPIRWPNPGDDSPPGAPVPWNPTPRPWSPQWPQRPWEITCNTGTTANDAKTGVIHWGISHYQ